MFNPWSFLTLDFRLEHTPFAVQGKLIMKCALHTAFLSNSRFCAASYMTPVGPVWVSCLTIIYKNLKQNNRGTYRVETSLYPRHSGNICASVDIIWPEIGGHQWHRREGLNVSKHSVSIL
jgi:hypothetical protein